MARVPYLLPEDLPEGERKLLVRPININRALANSPGALSANRFVGEWARYRSSIDPRLRELAILGVGVLTGNVYEYAHHVHFAKEFGATADDIDDVQRFYAGEPVSLDDTALVVLEVVRSLTIDGTLDDAGWAALEARLGRQTSVDLVFVVGYYNMVVRVLGALGVELEDEWAHHLKEHPLREHDA